MIALRQALALLRGRLHELGMAWVLLALCVLFSVLTWSEQQPSGAAAADAIAERILAATPHPRVLVAIRDVPDDVALADRLVDRLRSGGATVVAVAKGGPKDARDALGRVAAETPGLDAIAGSAASMAWGVFADVGTDFPALGAPALVRPRSYRWPNFLKAENLLNIANQIAVIAILAVGMTLVILTGGIDLSVGSIIALASVVTAIVIRDRCGGVAAGPGGMVVAGLVGIAVGAACGAVSGGVVVAFGIPPFIATLAMMLVAGGTASLLARGESVYQLPDGFMWLGRGADLVGIPNAVVAMLTLYALAQFTMTRTTFGRWVLAVGGNREAARLSGVPVSATLVAAYVLSGALAALGGVVMASQLKSGSPNFGQMYELFTIAAVVVGGTSLAGGEGSIVGTLVGALVTAVINNGMNLLGIESYTQRVVLGLVILGAVLLDRLRRR
ncbi:MAG: ABC transporter permease [Planctomycetes bacterium]|nr:ABC transporter permease [Planctomycetota bacterium]MBM4056851.1 ABC transporter permease [Planctomycetota bacterium]